MSDTRETAFMRTVDHIEYLRDRAVFIMSCGHDCTVFDCHAPALPELGSRRHCPICEQWARKPWPIVERQR